MHSSNRKENKHMIKKSENTLYDVLKVSRKATVSEIVSAYHTVKNAFSKDSVATYSLFSPEEKQGELVQVEEAYQILSNIDKRRLYDQHLEKHETVSFSALSELELKQKASASGRVNFEITPTPTVASSSPSSAPISGVTEPAEPIAPLSPCTGSSLKILREARGLTLEDVSRITKIPSKFVAALESEDLKRLPTRVYVQGFVKNLATLYRIDPKKSAAEYLDNTSKTPPP